MSQRAKHAFGSSENIASALAEGKIDAYDILFLDGDTDLPKVGWIDKDGNEVVVDTQNIIVVGEEGFPEIGVIGKIYIQGDDAFIYNGTDFVNICKPTDLTEIETQVSELSGNIDETKTQVDSIQADLDTKVNEQRVQEMIDASTDIEIIEF